MRSPRRSRNPARVVAIAGVMGTVVLGGLFVVTSDIAARGRPLSPGPIVEAPSTAVLSVRRAPTVLSVVSRTGRVSRSVRQVSSIVGSDGCMSVTWRGQSLGSHNADTPLIPASTMKLVTASAALEVLGGNHVYTTTVHGTVDATGTAAALWMVGGGDPVLVTADYPGTEKYPTAVGTSLEKLADSIVAAGVRAVTSGIIGVDGRYDAERYVPQWDVSLHKVEAGPLGALIVNDGLVMGETSKRDEPAIAAATELGRLLASRGVSVGAVAQRGELPQGTPQLAAIESAPMSAIVADMLARSDNNTAELILKEIGLSKKGEGSTARGAVVESEILAARGIVAGVQVADGSGLARQNRATCAALVETLSREVSVMPAMLAVAGSSGTLRDYFVDHPVKGRLVGKTGTLSGVKALAGYVLVDGDDPVVFALVLNRPGIDAPAAHRTAWISLADALARAKGSPRPDQLLP